MRRVGEANAKPTRRWVRGNFHITLTPALSLSEGEGVEPNPLAPFPGERGRVRGRKKEKPLIESGPAVQFRTNDPSSGRNVFEDHLGEIQEVAPRHLSR